MNVFPLQIYSCWIIRMLAALEAFQSFFFIHLRSFCVLLSLMENVFKKTSLTNYEMLLSVSVTRIQQQQRRPPSCLHCTFSHPLSQSTFVSRSSVTLWLQTAEEKPVRLSQSAREYKLVTACCASFFFKAIQAHPGVLWHIRTTPFKKYSQKQRKGDE